MAVPDVSPGGIPPGWLEGFGAFLLLLLTIGGQAWRYLKEINKTEPPRHMVLETAELADMQPTRAVLQKLDKIFEMQADLEQVLKDNHRILETLERIDRADIVERQVQARLREEIARLDRERGNR